jgi:riboflavin kinase, archaea type
MGEQGRSEAGAGAGEKAVMRVRGKVIAGVGESGKFLAIDWVNKEVCKKFNFTPFCGTLNIEVIDPAIQRILISQNADRITSCQEGFCDAVIAKGTIKGRYECGVIIPLVEGYPENVLEIVAPVHLKSALNINDGDEVELQLEEPATEGH